MRQDRGGSGRNRRHVSVTRVMFALPAIALFSIVLFVCVGYSLFYAFTNWDGFKTTFDFIGISNFGRVVTDPATLRAFQNTLVFTVANAPVQITIGLILALALKRPGRITSALRVIIVFPFAISGVVLGLIGTIIFDPRSGLLSQMQGIPLLGLLARNWLGDPGLAMTAVVAMNLWQTTGVTMIIFIAGLVTIPNELYEAAQIDGASPWSQFWNITWPLLAPAITVNTILIVIGGLRVFDIIYVLTGGGPGNATQSAVMYVAAQGSFNNFGYSSAISFTLTAVIVMIAFALLRTLRRREDI